MKFRWDSKSLNLGTNQTYLCLGFSDYFWKVPIHPEILVPISEKKTLDHMILVIISEKLILPKYISESLLKTHTLIIITQY